MDFSDISEVVRFLNSLSESDYQLIDVYSFKIVLLDKNSLKLANRVM